MNEDLNMFHNDYYTIIARDLADAVAVIVESGGDADGGEDLVRYEPNAVVTVYDYNARPTFSECLCAEQVKAMGRRPTLNAIGHHADCTVGRTEKTAREWCAIEGRGVLAMEDC